MKHNNNSIEYEYSERWWITKKKQIMPLTEKQAYERHKKGKPYSVQIYIDGILRYIADVCKDAYIISFIGKDKLSYCTCEYHLTEGRLFLSARYYNIWKNGTIVWQRINSYDINGEHICTVHEYCVDDRKKPCGAERQNRPKILMCLHIGLTFRNLENLNICLMKKYVKNKIERAF